MQVALVQSVKTCMIVFQLHIELALIWVLVMVLPQTALVTLALLCHVSMLN